MNKIIITIFIILVVPFLGLPAQYDRWVYGVLICGLLFFIYRVLKQVRSKEIEHEEQVAAKQASPKKKDDVEKPLISAEEKHSIKEAVKESKKK